MAGFTLRDSPAFDDWQFFQTESLRQELATALEKLIAGLSAQGSFQQAITHARQWLLMDTLREEAHRQLMRLYAWDGQRNAALRQYQECQRILEDELGVEPLDETTRLHQAILDNSLEPARVEAPAQMASMSPGALPAGAAPGQASGLRPAIYPLVGREHEWQALEAAYAAVAQGDGHLVVLEGEPGIGKTRLACEFITALRAQGAVALTAPCYQGENHLAYAPFVECLRSALLLDSAGWAGRVPDAWLSEAARLVPELIHTREGLPAAPPLESPGVQMRFFEALHQLLLAACGAEPPGVVFFDDLHWSDEASLDLLTYLVRRAAGRPLLLLASWRGESLPPGHRLRRLLAEARRSGRATYLPLERLDRHSVGRLIRAALPGENESIEARLYQESEGTPFFVVEYLAAIQHKERQAEDWTMPAGVRSLLHSRLDDVDETGQQLLQAAAAIGRAFDFDVLREASGRSEEEAVPALEDLLSRGLVRELQLGGETHLELVYDFSHEKMRELVYQEISLPRRRLLHRRIAQALAVRARSRPELRYLAGQIAYHFKNAGEASQAAEYYQQAGEHARSLLAHAEALAHFSTALAFGHPDTAGLNEAIGDIHTLRGDYPLALAALEAAAALVASTSDELPRLQRKIGEIYHRQGEWDQAESFFKTALDQLGKSNNFVEKAHLYASWARTAHQRGQSGPAQELAGQALRLAEQAGDPRALAQAHNILGMLLRSQGDLAQAAAHLENSLEIAGQLDDPSARIAAWNNLARVYADQNQLERAITGVQAALALCVQQGDRHQEAALHNNLADLYHLSGQREQAMLHLKKAVVIFSEIGGETSGMRPEIWKLMEW